jgi:hypothetical protein
VASTWSLPEKSSLVKRLLRTHLAKEHLYEYLHDNRIVYFREPTLGEAEPDLVALQGTDDPLIADAKIYTNRKGTITKGFHQVHNYAQKCHAVVGYLIVYNTRDGHIQIHADGQESTIQYIQHTTGIRIYFVIIETFQDPARPSDLPPLQPIVEIKREEIIKAIENPSEEENEP